MTPTESTAPAATDTYSSAIEEARNYTNWLVGLLAPFLHGEILEVGLGHGGYVSELAKFGRYTGLDLDPAAVAEAESRHPSCRFVSADIADTSFAQQFDAAFDAIVCINVLEHIEDDRIALEHLTKALRPGGHLLIVVPAGAALYNDMDRLAGHHRRYSLKQFKERITGLPLRTEQLRYFNPLGGLGWYLNKFKKYDSLNDGSINKQIKLFDRYLIPPSRALSPLFSHVFGQSLIFVGQTPEA